MAKIISMSLTETDLEKLNELTKVMQVSGRSETIRAGIELLSMEQKNISKIHGKISAIIIAVHEHSKSVSKILHESQTLIKTQTHTHVKGDRCAEILLLEGESEKIKNIAKKLQKDKKTILSKLIIL